MLSKCRPELGCFTTLTQLPTPLTRSSISWLGHRLSYLPIDSVTDSVTYPVLTRSTTPCFYCHPPPPFSFLFPILFLYIYRGLRTTFNRQSPHSFLTIGARSSDRQHPYKRLHELLHERLHERLYKRLHECMHESLQRRGSRGSPPWGLIWKLYVVRLCTTLCIKLYAELYRGRFNTEALRTLYVVLHVTLFKALL